MAYQPFIFELLNDVKQLNKGVVKQSETFYLYKEKARRQHKEVYHLISAFMKKSLTGKQLYAQLVETLKIPEDTPIESRYAKAFKLYAYYVFTAGIPYFVPINLCDTLRQLEACNNQQEQDPLCKEVTAIHISVLLPVLAALEERLSLEELAVALVKKDWSDLADEQKIKDTAYALVEQSTNWENNVADFDSVMTKEIRDNLRLIWNSFRRMDKDLLTDWAKWVRPQTEPLKSFKNDLIPLLDGCETGTIGYMKLSVEMKKLFTAWFDDGFEYTDEPLVRILAEAYFSNSGREIPAIDAIDIARENISWEHNSLQDAYRMANLKINWGHDCRGEYNELSRAIAMHTNRMEQLSELKGIVNAKRNLSIGNICVTLVEMTWKYLTPRYIIRDAVQDTLQQVKIEIKRRGQNENGQH